MTDGQGKMEMKKNAAGTEKGCGEQKKTT